MSKPSYSCPVAGCGAGSTAGLAWGCTSPRGPSGTLVRASSTSCAATRASIRAGRRRGSTGRSPGPSRVQWSRRGSIPRSGSGGWRTTCCASSCWRRTPTRIGKPSTSRCPRRSGGCASIRSRRPPPRRRARSGGARRSGNTSCSTASSTRASCGWSCSRTRSKARPWSSNTTRTPNVWTISLNAGKAAGWTSRLVSTCCASWRRR